MSGLYVRQHPLIGFASVSWEPVIPNVVRELQQEGEPVWLVPADAPRIDVLFLIYEATDHPRVVDSRRVETYLDSLSTPVGKLVICVVDVSRPKVTELQVREVGMDQVALPGQEWGTLRISTTADLAANSMEQIRVRLGHVRLAPSIGVEMSIDDGVSANLGESVIDHGLGWGSV